MSILRIFQIICFRLEQRVDSNQPKEQIVLAVMFPLEKPLFPGGHSEWKLSNENVSMHGTTAISKLAFLQLKMYLFPWGYMYFFSSSALFPVISYLLCRLSLWYHSLGQPSSENLCRVVIFVVSRTHSVPISCDLSCIKLLILLPCPLCQT